MRKPATGEPYAGKPPVRFGGRGGQKPSLPLSRGEVAPNHDRVFVGADNVAGAGTGADAGATATILSNFSSSGLKTNSLSCGVSMAWTQTCRFTPMSPR